MHPARFLRPKSTFLTIPILGDSSMQENYRGIAINSCIGKLVNTVLNNRLDKYLIDNNLINKCQIGFSKKARSSDHIENPN